MDGKEITRRLRNRTSQLSKKNKFREENQSAKQITPLLHLNIYTLMKELKAVEQETQKNGKREKRKNTNHYDHFTRMGHRTRHNNLKTHTRRETAAII